MKFKTILPILLLSFYSGSAVQATYTTESDRPKQFIQIDRAYLNEWVLYQTIVITNQFEKFKLEQLAIELDRSPYDQSTAQLFNQMLEHPKNSIARLEQLQLKNADLKQLIQLNIQEYQFDLRDLEQDFGITKVEYNNDEYMALFNEKQRIHSAFNELKSIVNQRVLSMILHNPLSSHNENDAHINLVNDWFRYQNTLNKIDDLEQQIATTSTRYLTKADNLAKSELKDQIDQYQETAQKILKGVKPKSPQVTELIQKLDASLHHTREYLRHDYAMRGIDGLIQTHDLDQAKEKLLGKEYFELTQKMKKNEYQIEKEVLRYLKDNPLK